MILENKGAENKGQLKRQRGADNYRADRTCMVVSWSNWHSVITRIDDELQMVRAHQLLG